MVLWRVGCLCGGYHGRVELVCSWYWVDGDTGLEATEGLDWCGPYWAVIMEGWSWCVVGIGWTETLNLKRRKG